MLQSAITYTKARVSYDPGVLRFLGHKPKKTLLKGLQIRFLNSLGLWTIARYRTYSSPLPAFNFLRKLCSPAWVKKSLSFHYRRS